MSWQQLAACRGMDPDMFFPARGDYEAVVTAKAVCQTCIVRRDCLAEHVFDKEGIYGGTTGRERRKMNQAAIARPVPCVECGRPFKRTNGSNLVCSDECRHARHNKFKAESNLRAKA